MLHSFLSRERNDERATRGKDGDVKMPKMFRREYQTYRELGNLRIQSENIRKDYVGLRGADLSA